MLARPYTIKELSDILSAESSGNLSLVSSDLDRIATDSRFRGIGKSSCFFAIKSKRNDGHNFIGDAYNKGVRCFVVSEIGPSENYADAIILKVPDVLNALQVLAKFHRREFKFPIVSITGSNGKTVVKEWLFQILSTQKLTVRSPKSYNSQIGVPLSVIGMHLKADIGIVEAGISEKGEMEK